MMSSGSQDFWRLANLRFVVDDEYAALVAAQFGRVCNHRRGRSTAPTGNVMVNAAPPSAGLSTVSVPPCASTCQAHGQSTPRPMPVGLVVK